jgi:hypothetical protein
MGATFDKTLEAGIYRLDISLSKKFPDLESKLAAVPRWSGFQRSNFHASIRNSWRFLKFASRATQLELDIIQDRAPVWSGQRLSLWFRLADIFVTKPTSTATDQMPRFLAAVVRELGINSSLTQLYASGVQIGFTKTQNVPAPLTPPTPAKPVVGKPAEPVGLDTPGYTQQAIGKNDPMTKGNQYVITMSGSENLERKQKQDFQNAMDDRFGQGVTTVKRFEAKGNKADVLILVNREPNQTATRAGKDAFGNEALPAVVILTALAILGALGIVWAISLTVERVAILTNSTAQKGTQAVNSLGAQIASAGFGISAGLLGLAALWYVFIRK